MAKIDYVVLERANEFPPLGSGMSLSSQAMRVFDQLGLLEDLCKIGIPTEGFKYFNRKNELVGTLNAGYYYEERHGYQGILVPRPALMNFLVSLIPKDKLLWGKRVLSTMQNAQGVLCRLADQTTIHGSILVGADGAYSAVRQSLYKNMEMKNKPASKSDTAPLRFDQFGVLGITEPIEDLPEETEGGKGGWMLTLLPEKETDCLAYVIRLPEGRLGWRIGGKVLSSNMKDHENFRRSEWGVEDIEDLKKEWGDSPAPLVGNVGVLFEKTKHISRIMLEEKVFDTWFEGRTVLIGDACHKMLPAAGQGTNQTIMDAVCIANLIQELSADSADDIKRAFDRYYTIRASNAKQIAQNSARFGSLLTSVGVMPDETPPMTVHVDGQQKSPQDGSNKDTVTH
ncbi:hypothetical protein DFQ26_002982 [Actinomortierella ambigua]|nr:hypothetical protein DFQ26_002982 [Actinomortierella ambigua]